MATRVFTKTALPSKLHGELDDAVGSLLEGISYDAVSAKVTISLVQDPTLEQDTDITNTVNNHVATQSQESAIQDYLALDIGSFIEQMMLDLEVENILLGITQLNKTTEVVGFFEEAVLLPTRTRKVSLKGSLDSKSLTVTLEILAYRIANPSAYSDLSPFVTEARLTQMYNKIATKLGLTTL